MDEKNNLILAAYMIDKEAAEITKSYSHIIEQQITKTDLQASNKPWANVNKSKLPRESFLWVIDPEKVSSWKLPYREGTGGIDPETGKFKQAGLVNLNALRAISAAVAGARTGKPMNVPSKIRKKLKKLLKKFKIGEIGQTKEQKNMPLPNFHAVRLRNPNDFNSDTFRVTKGGTLAGNKKVPAGINITWGKLKGKDSESDPVLPQSLKFPKESYSIEQVKNWLTTNNVKYQSIEKAVEESKKMKTVTFYESDNGSIFHNSNIDKENCVIKGMSILRPTSKNCTFKEGKGRRYSEKARQSAAKLIEGKKAYIDHQTKKEREETGGVRPLGQLVGIYENGRIDHAGVVRADLKYLKTQKVKEFMEALVELNADGVGGSIVAAGPSIYDVDEQQEIIMDILEMKSTDLVSETGSTMNLFESKEIQKKEEKSEKMDLTALNLTTLKESRPDLIKSVIENYQKQSEEASRIKSLSEKIKTLEKEKSDLNVKLDGYQLKEKVQIKKDKIENLIQEAELADEYVTDVFRESLMTAENEEAMKNLIDDRKKIVSNISTGVKGMGTETNVSESKSENVIVTEESLKEFKGKVLVS